ncbi:TRAP transporter small permease [Bosea sp. PAMC 26642]|uniref:TRAP transporter small permease n=1 Tax=Bosea sp. (strain PAMC 26642) TaxID=1792307 RepID=UPI000A82A85F|nr:TRAP transporter small permease [Bosea sp. PAMC 26642]
MSAQGSRPVALLLATERLVTGAALAMGCVAMTVAACAGLFQVLTRFILQEPATWSEPLIRIMLIWMAYLGLASAVRAGSLISVDLLYRLVRGRQRRALEAVIALATLSLLAVLVWFGIDLTNRVRFQNLAGLEIPVSYAYAAIPTGALISMLAVVAHFFDPRREELETAV